MLAAIPTVAAAARMIYTHDIKCINILKINEVNIFSVFALKFCLHRHILKVELLRLSLIFFIFTTVSQMWMSVKLVPTTVTCMPHV